MCQKESISVFLPGLYGGGAEKMMLDLCGAFAQAGHEVTLAVAREEGEFVDNIPEEVNLVDLDAPEPPGYNLLGALPSLVAHLRQNQPGVLLSALNRANIIAAFAGRMPGVDTRIVLSEHNHLSTYLEYAPRHERIVLPRLMAVTYPLADVTVCVSEGVREDLESSLGLNPDVTTMIYNAVITPEIRRMYREQASHPWLSSDIPVVMGLGSLTLQKDFPTLIRAVNVLRQTRECRLIIAGAGSQKKKLEALIERLGMADIADLPGFVDNPYAMMRQAEVFVLSSKWEGFGNVLVEALGCGCPVVSTDCPSGPAEILVGGKYGKLVPVGDEHRMADAIASQIDNPPSADRLRTRAEMFSLETIAEEYLDTLFDQ